MKITKYYEWLAIQNGNIIRMGITEEACKELNEIIFIELPIPKTVINKGDILAVLETTKSAIDIISPISGEIQQINDTLKKDVSILNRGVTQERWICDIAVTAFTDYHKLDNMVY